MINRYACKKIYKTCIVAYFWCVDDSVAVKWDSILTLGFNYSCNCF